MANLCCTGVLGFVAQKKPGPHKKKRRQGTTNEEAKCPEIREVEKAGMAEIRPTISVASRNATDNKK